MSRSYRKNPILKDNGTSKRTKRVANRVVRAKMKTGKYDEIGLGLSNYKKMFESWDICDYRFRKNRWDLERDISENGKSFAKAWGEYKKEWLCK